MDGNTDTDSLTWLSRPTRLYRIEQMPGLIMGGWTATGLWFRPGSGTTTTAVIGFAGSAGVPHRFFRVKALKPLSP